MSEAVTNAIVEKPAKKVGGGGTDCKASEIMNGCGSIILNFFFQYTLVIIRERGFVHRQGDVIMMMNDDATALIIHDEALRCAIFVHFKSVTRRLLPLLNNCSNRDGYKNRRCCSS